MRCHPRPSESCDFNSRLREETNPAEPTTSFSTKLISNHVSLRKRTPFFKCSLNALSVLQLTSPQRDEHFSSFNSLRIVYFNSRLCKETNAAFALLSPSATISIHVSLRRRTIWPLPHHSMVPFQFTSPFGDELLSSLACAKTLQFQITFPCGNERILIIWSTVPENFNSRLRNETNFEICSFR